MLKATEKHDRHYCFVIRTDIDGEFVTPSIFDDLREVVRNQLFETKSTIRRYETLDGYFDVFLEVVQPRPRLVIFGAGHDVVAGRWSCKSLGWHTTVVDTRARASSLERFQRS